MDKDFRRHQIDEADPRYVYNKEAEFTATAPSEWD